MFLRGVGRASNRTMSAAKRAQAISRHMASTSTVPTTATLPDDAPVVFKSEGSVRQYILNRPAKYNALNGQMLNILRPYVEQWASSELGKVLVGTGVGKAFCAGGDVVGVVEASTDESTRQHAIDFFRREFELDYILATLPKPYIVVMDGVTMGGGVGLASHAPFRIATENTVFAMPETKIGYAPDVGASHFLSRTDGELGTYMALTCAQLKGRAVFEHGFATHYVPSRRIPAILERLASIDDPTMAQIDSLIEESYSEKEPDEPTSRYVGKLRTALDVAFRHSSIEKILKNLESIAKDHDDVDVRKWAVETIEELNHRSPTSLVVALTAIRRGKSMSLKEALQMELNFATAYCNGASSDFATGVTSVLLKKEKTRPEWSPSTIAELNVPEVVEKFFMKYSPAQQTAPELTVPSTYGSMSPVARHPMQFALPSEEEIRQMVVGSHGQSGATTVTTDEVVEKFSQLRRGKGGVREKVLEVLGRKCVEVGEGKGDEKWLQWVH
ncbi:3-hydroxyisobutyryl-coenzyme A hydrolase [Cristinia sonorae]|uniref:3-hydroxyisobutyryl-CoA hydrolase n=1 Tax=Cristinia sonorae TaxID=1940300 RepID=A0A8K0XPI4_9AGAR|nr:3-hydroxyisobutyryl-coenzyme A hydrolase [Cristinia sonorae]